jgi:hypothetical protein
MHDAIGHIAVGYLIVLALLFCNIIFLDSAALRSRQRSLLGNVGGALSIWLGIKDKRITYLFFLLWIVPGTVCMFVGMFNDHPATHPKVPPPLWQEITIATIGAIYILIFMAAMRLALRSRILKKYQISRGLLLNAVNSISRNAKVTTSLGQVPPVYVIPDSDFARTCPLMRIGVVIPLRLLDLLTRREIDALAAQQLCLQSYQIHDPALWILLGCNVVVVSLAQWLQIGPLLSCLVYPSLLAAELYTLSRYLPHILFQADLRAIRLTGNADAFFSAMGGLSRFTGVPPSEPMLLQLGRATGVLPEQIKELLVEHETKPEDRYLTTGSYMETGL